MCVWYGFSHIVQSRKINIFENHGMDIACTTKVIMCLSSISRVCLSVRGVFISVSRCLKSLHTISRILEQQNTLLAQNAMQNTDIQHMNALFTRTMKCFNAIHTLRTPPLHHIVCKHSSLHSIWVDIYIERKKYAIVVPCTYFTLV